MAFNENQSISKEFIVRESVFYNYFLGFIFLAIFIGILFTIKGQENFTGADYIKFGAMILLPAIGLFIHGSRRNLVLKMNTTGIYFGKDFITSWDRLVTAYVSEVDEDKGNNIHFSLYVEYYPQNYTSPYIIDLPLSGTIDKSVEEITAAIDEFLKIKSAGI